MDLQAISQLVANKKLLGWWLALLTVGLGGLAERYFAVRSTSLIIETKLDSIKEAVEETKATSKENSDKLERVLIEQAAVKAELRTHERDNAAAKRKASGIRDE